MSDQLPLKVWQEASECAAKAVLVGDAFDKLCFWCTTTNDGKIVVFLAEREATTVAKANRFVEAAVLAAAADVVRQKYIDVMAQHMVLQSTEGPVQ